MPYIFNPFTNNLDATASLTVPPGTVATLTGNDSIAVGPNGSGNINFVGDGITINVTGNAGDNTLTIAAIAPTAFVWQTVTIDTPMAINNGYIVSGDAINLLMPPSANIGDVVKVSVPSVYGGSFNITQPDNVEVELGNSVSTFGTGGSVVSTDPGSFITLVCTISEEGAFFWSTEASVGNFTIT